MAKVIIGNGDGTVTVTDTEVVDLKIWQKQLDDLEKLIEKVYTKKELEDMGQIVADQELYHLHVEAEILRDNIAEYTPTDG